MKEPLKIRNSKGELYLVCPIINKIECILSKSNIEVDTLFVIKRHLHEIQEIAKVWQKELGYSDYLCTDFEYAASQIAKPYNYTAVLGHIRMNIKNNSLTEEKLNEILELYL